MENQQISPAPQDLDNFFNLAFDGPTRTHIRQAALWAKISTICTFVGYGILLIIGFIGKPTYSYATEGDNLTRTVTTTSIFSTIITVAVGVFINYFLYRFATSAMKGIDSMDNYSTNQGFSSLRTYFKIVGICLIIVFCFIIIGGIFFLISLGAASRI